MHQFVAALRSGDVAGVIAILAPDVVVTFGDHDGNVSELRGDAEHVGRAWTQGAAAFAAYADLFVTVLIDGSVGLLMAPKGRVLRALRFTFDGGRIARADVIADRPRLDALDIATLDDDGPAPTGA